MRKWKPYKVSVKVKMSKKDRQLWEKYLLAEFKKYSKIRNRRIFPWPRAKNLVTL